MTASKSKSYLAYLNKLVDEYNNSYHHSFDKESIDGDFFLFCLKKLNLVTKHLNVKSVTDQDS